MEYAMESGLVQGFGESVYIRFFSNIGEILGENWETTNKYQMVILLW